MKEFYKGLKDGIPIALGYFAVSFSFGILALKGRAYGIPVCIYKSYKCYLCGTVCGTSDNYCRRNDS